MTGITQSPPPPPTARPIEGRVSFWADEQIIERLLAAADVEVIVDRWWHTRHPQQIADHINRTHKGLGMTARWVWAIKQRLTNKRR